MEKKPAMRNTSKERLPHSCLILQTMVNNGEYSFKAQSGKDKKEVPIIIIVQGIQKGEWWKIA